MSEAYIKLENNLDKKKKGNKLVFQNKWGLGLTMVPET
jgi:hypothetical protein